MMQIARKTLNAQLTGTAKGFSAVITAETLDRDGEVLMPQGMNSQEFEKNPTLFWNHDYSLPIGRNVALKRRDRDIVGEFVFAQRPDGHAGDFFPEVAAALVAQGVVNAVSVGAIPEENGIRKASEVDRKRYGNRVERIISRWKLMEVSLAPLQANPEAVITAVRKGACSPDSARKWFGVSVPKRTIVTVEIPAPSSPMKSRSMTVSEIVDREIARARGSIYLR